jgi:Histidine kinase-, DNA gyrase B-, and HSP90-like ATPase.
MPSDYEAITRYNEDQLGKDTASRKSQVNMYSDFSHFVYEILQNADDHDATTITFNLTPEELKIEHNGIPFNEENVKAISYFGKSTSRDDLIKTGQFGLGFKSVFAFTATPAIYSGEEDFQIHGLYVIAQ